MEVFRAIKYGHVAMGLGNWIRKCFTVEGRLVLVAFAGFEVLCFNINSRALASASAENVSVAGQDDHNLLLIK